MDVGDAQDWEPTSGFVLLEDGLDAIDLLLGLDSQHPDGRLRQAQLKANVVCNLHVGVRGQVDDGWPRKESLEAVEAHLRVVLVQGHPRDLDEAVARVVVAVGRAVLEPEQAAYPEADLGGDSCGQPLQRQGLQGGYVCRKRMAHDAEERRAITEFQENVT